MKIRIEKTARIDCETLATVGKDTRYNLYVDDKLIASSHDTATMKGYIAIYKTMDNVELDTIKSTDKGTK